jgi:hypothetical protein
MYVDRALDLSEQNGMVVELGLLEAGCSRTVPYK